MQGLVTKLGIVHIWGLTSEIRIPLQELELKIGGGLTCEGGFYGIISHIHGHIQELLATVVTTTMWYFLVFRLHSSLFGEWLMLAMEK